MYQSVPGIFYNALPLTKSDTTAFAPTRALYVGGAGDVTVQMGNGVAATPVTFKAVPAGTTIPIGATQLLSTGTTATNCMALY